MCNFKVVLQSSSTLFNHLIDIWLFDFCARREINFLAKVWRSCGCPKHLPGKLYVDLVILTFDLLLLSLYRLWCWGPTMLHVLHIYTKFKHLPVLSFRSYDTFRVLTLCGFVTLTFDLLTFNVLHQLFVIWTDFSLVSGFPDFSFLT